MTNTEFDVNVEELLKEYLAVCNRAMAENVSRFWYRQAKRLNRMLWDESNFRTIIYDKSPDDIVAEHTIHFDPEERALSLRPPGVYEVAFAWKVPLSYLQDVVKRADWYAEHPVMLDWKWFTGRIRTAVPGIGSGNRALSWGAGAGLAATLGAVSLYYLRTMGKRRR